MKNKNFKNLLVLTLITFTVTVQAQNWVSIKSNIPLTSSNLTSDCYEILPVSNQTILAATSAGIYRSTNDGGSWTSTGVRGSNGFKKVKNNRVLALGLGGILGPAVSKSDDGGLSWNSSVSGIDPDSSGNVSVEDISVSPNGTIYIVSRQNGGVYASTNNGDTWVEKAKGVSGGALWSVLAIDDNTIIVGASNGIYRSTDAGSNWTRVLNTSSSSSYVMTMKKNSIGTIYAGLASGIVRKSVNGGLTWTNTSIGDTKSAVYDIEIDSDDNIYVCFFNSLIGVYNKSEIITGFWWPQNGLVNTRVYGLSIDQGSTTRKFYACSAGNYNTGGDMYRLETTLGLETLASLSSISVYPNPSSELIQVTGIDYNKGVQAKIISMDGKVLKTEMMLQSVINISALNPGIYLIEITDENGRKNVSKFIKK